MTPLLRARPCDCGHTRDEHSDDGYSCTLCACNGFDVSRRSSSRQGYAATAPCGCVYALFTGSPSKGIVKDMAQGATIRPVSREEGNALWGEDCPHSPKWGGLSHREATDV